ncbi:MAG: CehA/McbA family metallohydrolase [Deltaproteobacteria bacterium]|nr:CehA/McbA family metallohydrolase [Deltaproteobacteria bacterium]
MTEQLFRYETSGLWLKGNVHMHSTASDGGKSVSELAELYGEAGYDFLCLTDHWVAGRTDLGGSTGPLILGGVELHGYDRQGFFYHVVCIGDFEGIAVGMDFEEALKTARSQGGILILAHPHWTGNTYEQAKRHGFDGVEIYNAIAHWMNGKCCGLGYWDAMLEDFPDVSGFAVDDTHLRSDGQIWKSGWVWVNVKERTPAAIIAALRKGNFCASTGPQILSLEVNAEKLHVRSTAVKFARIVGEKYAGRSILPNEILSDKQDAFTEFELTLPEEYDYLRLEIEDAHGGRAWTNTLFTKCIP